MYYLEEGRKIKIGGVLDLLRIMKVLRGKIRNFCKHNIYECCLDSEGRKTTTAIEDQKSMEMIRIKKKENKTL